MKNIAYFPLITVIAFWVLIRSNRKTVEVNSYSLAEWRGCLEGMQKELENTQPEWIRQWLIHKLEKELQIVQQLQHIGLFEAGYVPKK